MKRRKINGYVPLTKADSTSEKCAHFLAYAHKNRPGERIPYRDIDKAISGYTNASIARIKSIKKSFQHIKRILRDEYDLGWDADPKDGIRPIYKVDEVVAIGAADGVQQMAIGQKRIGEQVALAKRLGGIEACSDTPLGHEAARFLTKAESATRVALPNPKGIRLLLVAATDDK